MKGIFSAIALFPKNVSLSIRLLLAIFLTITFTFSQQAFADTASGLNWIASQEAPTGEIISSEMIATDFQSTHEALIAYDFYESALSSNSLNFINSHTFQNTESISRRIVLKNKLNQSYASDITLLLQHQNSDGGFGEFPGYQSTSLDTAFALQAMSAANVVGIPSGLAVNYLVTEQNSDGGFSLNDSNPSAVYITALASIALQQYRFVYSIGSSIDLSSQYLLQTKIAGNWGSNWETALALSALAPVIVDSTQYVDAVENLRSNQQTSGSWNNDVYITALALQALFIVENIEFPVDPTTANLTGRVVNQLTGLPLLNASLTTDPASIQVETDENGDFNLQGLDPGSYTARFDAAGFISSAFSINVAAGQVVNFGTVSLTPEPTTGFIFGTISDASTNQPLQGVSIQLSGDSTESAITDANGYFSIVSLPGSITITASIDGYDPSSGTATLTAGSSLNFSPGLNLSGTTPPDSSVTIIGGVFDTDTNAPIEGATVSIIGTTNSAISLVDGTFILENVEAGELNIIVSKTGYQSQAYDALASASGTLDLGSVLLSSADVLTTSTVIGVITDESTGSPILGAIVSIEGTSLNATTDANGSYSIEGILELDFVVQVSAVGYLSTSGAITVLQPQLVDATVALQPTQIDGFAISALSTTLVGYDAHEKIYFDANFQNNGSDEKTVELLMTVTNSIGEVVDQFTAAHSELPGDISDSILTIAAGSTIETQFEWMNRSLPPGNYEVLLEAYSNTGSIQLAAQRSTTVIINSSLSVPGLTVIPVPQFTNVGAIEEVSFKASLSNKSNTASNIVFMYRWLDPNGVLISEGTVDVPLNPDEMMADVIFGTQQYEFVASGEYAIEITVMSGPTPDNIASKAISVAPTVRIDPSQSLAPETIVPDGDKRIRIKIKLQGRNEG